MRKKKRRNKKWTLWHWFFLIIIGLSVMVFTDALCDVLKSNLTEGTYRVMLYSGIILGVAIILGFGNRIVKKIVG